MVHFHSTLSILLTAGGGGRRKSQQRALVGWFHVFRGASLLQPLRPYSEKLSHFQLLIPNWPNKLSCKVLLALCRSPVLRSSDTSLLLPVLSHTNVNKMLVSSCWLSVPMSLYLELMSTPCHLVCCKYCSWVLVLLSGYCAFFNVKI